MCSLVRLNSIRVFIACKLSAGLPNRETKGKSGLAHYLNRKKCPNFRPLSKWDCDPDLGLDLIRYNEMWVFHSAVITLITWYNISSYYNMFWMTFEKAEIAFEIDVFPPSSEKDFMNRYGIQGYGWLIMTFQHKCPTSHCKI